MRRIERSKAVDPQGQNKGSPQAEVHATKGKDSGVSWVFKEKKLELPGGIGARL